MDDSTDQTRNPEHAFLPVPMWIIFLNFQLYSLIAEFVSALAKVLTPLLNPHAKLLHLLLLLSRSYSFPTWLEAVLWSTPIRGLSCFISPCPDSGNPKVILSPRTVDQWKCAVVCLTEELILWRLALFWHWDGLIYLFVCLHLLQGNDIYQSSKIQSPT